MSFYYVTTNKLASASTITPSGAAHALFGTAYLYDGLPCQPFKFNAAGSGNQITIDFGSATTINFCSIHGHNIDSGITDIQLRSSTDNFSSSDTLEATMTKAVPSFYCKLGATVSRRYWRIKFVGTNGSPISLGEVWLGLVSTLGRNQRWGWDVEVSRPQLRQRGPSGQLFATNRTDHRQRVITFEFLGLTETQKDEIEESLIDASGAGEDPIIIVPDSSDDIVVHGRMPRDWAYKRIDTGGGAGGYVYGLSVEEDPFEAAYQ